MGDDVDVLAVLGYRLSFSIRAYDRLYIAFKVIALAIRKGVQKLILTPEMIVGVANVNTGFSIPP